MAFELAIYGGMAGFLYQVLPGKKWRIYVALVISMISGRIVWGIVNLFLAGITGSSFTWSIFIAGAVVNAIPGIIMQLILIPIIVIAMEKVGLSIKN